MKRSLVLIAAVAATAFLAVIGASSEAKKGKPDKGEPATFTLVQTITSLHQVDNPPPGPSAGDLTILTQDEKSLGASEDEDSSDEHLAATSEVYCVAIAPPKALCTATHIFDDGQITASGPLDPSKTIQSVAITGGTGSFEGARGSIEVKSLGPGQSESTFHLIR